MGAQKVDRVADRFLGITFDEFEDVGLHAARRDEGAADVELRREGENRGKFGTLMSEQMRHDTAQREDEKLGTRNAVGQEDGGFHRLVLVGLQRGVTGETAGGIFFLNAPDDGVEHFNALVRVAADAGLATEHDAIHLLNHGIENICHLGARRHGVFDHAFQHLGGDNDFAPVEGAALDDMALDQRQVFNGTLAAEIAARDHDAGAGLDQGVNVFQGLLVFNLGDDAGLAAFLFQKQLQVLDVSRLAGKAEGEKIHFQLHSEIEIGVVFFCQRRQTNGHAGKIDVTAGFHFSLGQHGADDTLVTDLRGFDLNHAAIDHDDITDLHIPAEIRVIDRDGKRDRGGHLRLAAKLDDVTHLKLPGLLDIAGSDARAREVHEHRDLSSGMAGSLANPCINRAHPFMGGMAHVQADHIRTFGDQGL